MIECRRCERLLDESRFEKNRRTCRKCRSEYKRKHEVICVYCGKTFKSHNVDAKYCDRKCLGRSRRRRTIVNCSFCGEDKEIIKSVENRVERHYCNQDCRTEHMKIIYKGKGNHNYKRFKKPCDGCGDVIKVRQYELKNLKHNFCSRACFIKNIGRFYSGENNNNWNHNLSTEERVKNRSYPEYYKWRENVYSRDHYTCQSCGSSESGTLNAHHIENYSENIDKRTCLDNGITLCESCHTDFHKTYGFTGNNLDQLIEYLKRRESVIA